MVGAAIILGGLLLALAVVLVAGSLASIDRSMRHTKDTAALPLLGSASSADGSDGRQPRDEELVQIEAAGFVFRARLRNLSGNGEPLVLLHGFPQTSAAWEPMLDAAARKGFRVVAFDQRGYSPGARPEGAESYTLDKLVGDVLAVADALGFDRFHLVGHDWGAAVGWALVMHRPDRVRSWSALSIAHNASFLHAVRHDPEQRRKSSYMLLFRARWLPEALLSWGSHLLLRRLMYRHMPAAHQREYLRVFAEPGALSAALNWYRAMGEGKTREADPSISLPVLFIWGNRDPAAGRAAVEHQRQFMHGPYRLIELDAGHWLLEHCTDDVVEAVLEHVSTHAGGEGGERSADRR